MNGTNKLYKFIYVVFRPLVKFIFRIKIAGEKNEPPDTNFLVCANHISNLDVLILAASLNHQLCFLAKSELFKIPILSSFLRAAGAFPIDRKSSDVGALKKTIALLQDGKCVAMYPQGTRFSKVDPRMTQPKSGIGMIAARSGCTVLPVSIQTKNYSVRLFKKTYVTIGKPVQADEISPSALNSAEYTRISRMLFDRVLNQMKNDEEL